MYGVMNAATELFTHGISKTRDTSSQFWNSSFGADDKMKTNIYSELIGMCV
jgi:hypothetical protein